MKAKDIRIGDIINGHPVTSVERRDQYVISTGASYWHVTGDYEITATRPPTRLAPALCKNHNVTAGGVKMHVEECFDDVNAIVLIGRHLATQARTWVRVSADEDLELV